MLKICTLSRVQGRHPLCYAIILAPGLARFAGWKFEAYSWRAEDGRNVMLVALAHFHLSELAHVLPNLSLVPLESNVMSWTHLLVTPTILYRFKSKF